MNQQFAPVAGLGLLQELDRLGCLGNYHLLLAHAVLSNPIQWAAFFEKRRAEGEEDFIIMDNSLIELGYPMPPGQLIIACQLVQAAVLVLPDVMGDAKKTIALSTASFQELKDRGYEGSTMGVVHGENWLEAYGCAMDLKALGADYLSIPRVMTQILGSRKRLAEQVCHFLQLPVHLLGFSDDLADDIESAMSHHRIMGIDSAMPLWWGQQNKVLSRIPEAGDLDYGKRPEGYLGSTTITPHVIANLSRMNQWLTGATVARIKDQRLTRRAKPMLSLLS